MVFTASWCGETGAGDNGSRRLPESKAGEMNPENRERVREKGLWPRLPCQRPPIGAGTPVWDHLGTLASQERRNATLKPKFGGGDCVFAGCSSLVAYDPRPQSPGHRGGPHPSRSLNGISPKPPQNRDPQFRRRKLRKIGEEGRRGQGTLPRRDWLGGVAVGRKSRRATSAGSESFSQVGGAARGSGWATWR